MDTVFSSIDTQGRYKYGSQAHAAQWNLARLADSLLPLLDNDAKSAITLAEDAIASFGDIFNQAWISGMRRKLGLLDEEAGDFSLAQDLLEWMQSSRADYTQTFRDLSQESLPDNTSYQLPLFQEWQTLWHERRKRDAGSLDASIDLMCKSNPAILANNHHVEESLSSAEDGDLTPFLALLEVLQHPFEETPSNARYRNRALLPDPYYQTFCGT
jgi:uncharacterized protein YdiU (UPF0061 family)